MKKSLLALGLMTSLATLAHAGFTPIPLNSASYNRDIVIEATAPRVLSDAVTATMDGGTNRTGNTFFEQGYLGLNSVTGLPYTNGLPAHGSFVTNVVGDHYWKMAPDYHTNNVILVGHANGGRTPLVKSGTFNLTAPAKFGALSFLGCSGNGPVTVQYTIHYADASTESDNFAVYDWFNAATPVINAAGRLSVGGGLANIDAVGCKVFQFDINVGNPSGIITSIDIAYANAAPWANGRAAIFAVAGSTDGVNWSPVGVTGYNHDVIVEADGPQTAGGATTSTGAITNQIAGAILTNYVTSTMDGGTNKTGNTWYEQGFVRTLPTSGIPAAGSTFSSATISATYTMPPSYVGPCAAVVGGVGSASANLIPATPGSYGALSFLCAAANGDTFVPCTVQFQDGSSENNVIFVADWFDRNIPWAYRSIGRVNPNNNSINNTIDQFVNPFALGLGTFDFRGLGLPVPQLRDSVINIANSSGIITNIVLNFTNGTASTRVCSFFAVSGAAAGNVPPVFGTSGTPTPGQPLNAAVNAVNLLKTYAGTNNVVLAVTNVAGSGINYQWKKAPRGGGLRDIYYSFDYSTFANLTDGGRISGSQSSALVITNADLADSADYLVVASNAYGAATSTVVTLMVLNTNKSLLVGKPLGDQIAQTAADSTPVAEFIGSAIDQAQQKWLSSGLQNIPAACCGGILPWTGPVGFTVVPVSGASIVSALRFYVANDSNGRDPLDYALDGSNDGGSTWTPITGGVLKGTLSLPTTRGGSGSTANNPLTQPCVEVNFANPVGYSSYRVSITNNINQYGDALMQVAEVELDGVLVPNPPVWVRQPVPNAVVFAGASPVAVATAVGNPSPKYQWYNGSTKIAGATSTSYTVTNIQLAASGTILSCVASNSFGAITSTVETITVIPAPTQSYPGTVLADGPVAYFRLNESPDDGVGDNGVVTHDYVGAHNGYYSNAVINVSGYNAAVDPDTAATFGTVTSQDSYVDGILDVDFSRPTNATAAFSVEAWVSGGTQTGNPAIVTKGYYGILTVGTGTGTEQFALDLAGSPQTFRFLVRDLAGNAHVAQSSIDPASGAAWHHLLGVCDQPHGVVNLYVDGALAGSGTIATNVGIEAQPLPVTIGARKSSAATEFVQQFVGSIDDVAIYNTALTPAQALAHFIGGQRAPIISLQPVSITTNANVTTTFQSAAYGFGTVSYQWWNSDGTSPTSILPGKTAPNLSFTTTAAQNGNYYQVVASNSSGSTTSAVAQLTVYSGAPSFSGTFVPGVATDLNAADSFTLGHIITLSVDPSGTAPFTYVWKRNGTTITDDYRTFGSTTKSLHIGYAAPGDTATYQVFVTSALGPPPSTLDNVSVSPVVPPDALNATTNGWTFNTTGTGAPTTGMAANKVTLTSGAGSTASSAWVNNPIPIGSFNATFIYQDTTGSGGADGATFTLQNSALDALGGGGGSIGYGGTSAGFSAVTPSVALAFNVYASNLQGVGYLTDGIAPGNGSYVAANPVLIGQNTDQIRADITYDGTTLTTKLTDLTTAATFTISTNINIPAIIGSGTAYVGFTGGDGGAVSTQIISNFSMFSAPSLSLKVQQVAGNVVLTWPVAVGGAYLQSSPTLGAGATWTNDNVDTFRVVGTQGVVTVTPGGANQFYRLQVFP